LTKNKPSLALWQGSFCIWAGSARKEQIIPQAAFSLPARAGRPRPANGAEAAKMPAIFTWYPGDYAASHGIYFGTDKDAVINATTASLEYKGTRAIGSESYDPCKLAWDTMAVPDEKCSWRVNNALMLIKRRDLN